MPEAWRVVMGAHDLNLSILRVHAPVFFFGLLACAHPNSPHWWGVVLIHQMSSRSGEFHSGLLGGDVQIHQMSF